MAKVQDTQHSKHGTQSSKFQPQQDVLCTLNIKGSKPS
jgi:hypothetical protein